MADFSEVTVSSGADELLTLRPNVNKFKNVTGGKIRCLKPDGEEAASIWGEDSSAGVSLVSWPNGLAAGIITRPGYGATIDLRGSASTMLLDAQNGKIALNGPSSTILVDAQNGSLLIKGTNGQSSVNLGTNGNLALGGDGQSDGDLDLYSKANKLRVTIGADEMTLRIQDDNGAPLVVIGGSTGDIVVKGRIQGGGDLSHQRITERSRKVDKKMTIDLFDVNQNGVFFVELAASYSDNFDPRFFGSSYYNWFVFTFKVADSDFNRFSVAQGGVGGFDSSNNGKFWIFPPDFSEANGKARLRIEDFAFPHVEKAEFRDATLSVRALYGSLLPF